MVKVNLKNKLAFLNKSKAINSNNNNFELDENINTNANWFQSMEPVTYAKKNGKKLYKFKKIKINHEDTKTFKKLLFNDLKKQLDQYKQKIKQEFLRDPMLSIQCQIKKSPFGFLIMFCMDMEPEL